MKTLLKLAAFLLSFIPFAASAQTIQPPNITIFVPCQQQNLPKGGGKVNLVMCPLTITPAPITLPPHVPATHAFTCTAPQNILGIYDMTKLSCVVSK